MKRLMISLLMLIGICVQGFAADLTGKWKTTINDDGKDMLCMLTIMEKDLLFSVTVSEEDDEMGVITMLIDVPGTYTREGNKLDINLQQEGISLKMKEFKPKDEELKKMLEENAEAKEVIAQLIEGLISAYKDQLIGDDSFLGGELTIQKLTSTTLTLQDEKDQDLTFTRVK